MSIVSDEDYEERVWRKHAKTHLECQVDPEREQGLQADDYTTRSHPKSSEIGIKCNIRAAIDSMSASYSCTGAVDSGKNQGCERQRQTEA